MLGELRNEARITVVLHTKSPLSIRSAEGKLLDPTLPDMQCIKSSYQGKDVPIIPGSSLKGVIRSRYEKIVSLFGGKCCNVFGNDCECKKPDDWKDKSKEEKRDYIQKIICPACQFFGSQVMASKIYIADAYPVGGCTLGERTGVGINRITGAAQKGALYNYEVVEEGSFQAEITLKNYELYQMVLLMFVLKDLDEGYVSLGAASTRGNGRMEVKKVGICLREYRESVKGWRGAVGEEEILQFGEYSVEYDWGSQFYGEMKLPELELEEIIKGCRDVEIRNRIQRTS